MQTPNFLIKPILLPIMLISMMGLANGQFKQDSLSTPGLYKEIAHMDSLLFNALNSQDLSTIAKLFDSNLEFYHDLGGLTNYEQNIKATKSNFSKNNGLRRELVPGSMEVYPIKDYGAIQTGSHIFCHNENGKQDCGTFKFVHVWQKKNDEWKLTRVISYGH